jgi:hypothetical protein
VERFRCEGFRGRSNGRRFTVTASAGVRDDRAKGVEKAEEV